MTQPFDPASIAYYDEHSDEFVAATSNVDMQALYEPFLRLIPDGGRILDLGCGSGRDAKYFAEHSYEVIALDASAEMVTAARRHSLADVRQMRFDEMSFSEEFDGIWACASLLHVPRDSLSLIIQKCLYALREGGVLYVSFKLGSDDRREKGRLFADLKPEHLSKLIRDQSEHIQISDWITGDVRPGREEERWLNAIIRK